MAKQPHIRFDRGPATVPPYDFEGRIREGLDYHQAGHLRDAEAIYRQILKIAPDHGDANHLLGVVSHQRGRVGLAGLYISNAIEANPRNADYHNNLGNVLEKMGRPEDAAISYRAALALQPDFAEAHGNLGNALQELGRGDDAVASYRAALALRPDYAKAHNNLGSALETLGRTEDALASYGKALIFKPDFAEAHGNLANAYLEIGRTGDAIAHCRSAIALNPGYDLFWDRLAKCLKTHAFASVDDDLLQVLSHLLRRGNVRPHAIVGAVISALRHHPDVSDLLKLARPGTSPGWAESGIVYADAARRLAAIPLFLQIIGLSAVPDPEVENLLTTLRRAMIGAMNQADPVAGEGPEVLPFTAALALHCFTNEYVFAESAEETVAVEGLERRIAALLENGHQPPPATVAALGAYRPLHLYPWAGKIVAGGLLEWEWTGGIKDVIARQILEPQEERALRGRIPRLTAIEDKVSLAVRAQYEENPYPRWIKTSLSRKADTIGNVLSTALPHLDLGSYQSPERPEILVAGSGTGQHALATAAMYSDCRVLAVDLSLTSLAYAARKTSELGVTNIEHANGDILEMGGLVRRFDVIECAGVLHHMADPMAGWRVLVDLLRPGGLMKIALYSETGRADVVQARALIAEKQYGATATDIRRCRGDIMAMVRDGDPAMAKSIICQDFFSLSECRDMLFHVQEHRFTLPEIETALDELRLEFLGFDMNQQGALKAFSAFSACHPNSGALSTLALWHRFELANPDTFPAMYNFWCRKA